jgi:hypothetical protein
VIKQNLYSQKEREIEFPSENVHDYQDVCNRINDKMLLACYFKLIPLGVRGEILSKFCVNITVFKLNFDPENKGL